jgi:hypothetical protein
MSSALLYGSAWYFLVFVQPRRREVHTLQATFEH